MARTIEHLVNLYPNKTGAEILEIHKNELLEDKQREEKEKAHLQKIVDDINENGAYFKGAFGADQYYFFKVDKAEIDEDKVMCDFEKIILFNNLGLNSFNYEIDNREYVSYDDIPHKSTRITETEYNELKNYLFGVVLKFFPTEWNERQNNME